MMHIEMRRTYNSVGEGMFCKERFEVGGTSYCFVFGCGSSTSLNMQEGTSAFVSREIDFSFREGEAIDAIFISHYDREHINGLEELLCRHPVKKLFLPMLAPESRLFLTLNSYIEFSNASGEFVRVLISAPQELLQDKRFEIEQIILIEEMAENSLNGQQPVIDFEEISGKIASGVRIQCKFGMEIPIWEFVLANFREEIRIQRLIKEFHKRRLPIPKNTQDVNRLWDRYYKEIVRMFMEDLLEDFSTNELVVYSGKVPGNYEVEMRPVQEGKSWGACRSFFRVRSGCMYLGDYSLEKRIQWNRLKHVYGEEWEEISVWQLPHHGSAKYFRHEVAVHHAELYIACASSVNIFQHPGRAVIRKLELTGKKLYLVNEEPENRVVFLYEFSGADD